MGPSPLAQGLVGDRQQLLLAEGCDLPQQPRRRASHPVTGAEASFVAPARVVGAGRASLRHQPFGEADAGPHHRPPDDPREHLATWLGVSEGRVSQVMRSLVDTWGLVERQGKRGDTRYTLSAEGIRYVTHRDRAQLPTTRGIWSTALTTDKQGRRKHVGHRIETWARQTKHADGITWFLSKLEAETREDSSSKLQWTVPTARSDRAYNWGDSAIAPDAVGHLLAGGLHVPFYLEHELRARHPRGVLARLRPYESYYWSPEHEEDQPPFPTTLFVVDTEEVEDTYVNTASRRTTMSLPILVSCIPVLSTAGILGQSWRPLWEPESPRLPLSGLSAYQWDSLYHRMRHRPVEGDR